jgi:hypothetical protein
MQQTWKVKIPRGQQATVRRRAVYDVLERHRGSYQQRSRAADAFHKGEDADVSVRNLGIAQAMVAELRALGLTAQAVESPVCDSNDASTALPKKGEIIRLARRRLLVFAAFAFVAAAVGLYFKIGGRHEDAGYASFAMAAVGLVLCLWEVCNDLRLVIADDCLQLVHGRSKLVGCIPFEEITGVDTAHPRLGPLRLFWRSLVVEVRLRGRAGFLPAASGRRWPRRPWPPWRKARAEGRSAGAPADTVFWLGAGPGETTIVLEDQFAWPLAAIHKLLRSRWEEYVRRDQRGREPN